MFNFSGTSYKAKGKDEKFFYIYQTVFNFLGFLSISVTSGRNADLPLVGGSVYVALTTQNISGGMGMHK